MFASLKLLSFPRDVIESALVSSAASSDAETNYFKVILSPVFTMSHLFECYDVAPVSTGQSVALIIELILIVYSLFINSLLVCLILICSSTVLLICL